MLALLLAAISCVHAGELGKYQKYVSCINNPKFEMTDDIQTGLTPEECATLCKELAGKGCLSFEYNENTQECRPQKKYAPNVRCKNPVAGEVLFSLPDPKAPSVTAATSKVKSCAQIGGPYQRLSPEMNLACSMMSTNMDDNDVECLKRCEEDEECTDYYFSARPDGNTFCGLMKCPDTELNSKSLEEDGKMSGRWYKCKETEDLCPVVASGALRPAERQVSACVYSDRMDGKTHKECEELCMADSECTTFMWIESETVCLKMKCPPGINAYRPDPKMPADMKYYKCKDGEVGPCVNNDLEVQRQIKELCETRGIKKKKCPATCAAVVNSPSFKLDPLCDRVNPVAWFPDACPFSCPNARVNCQRSETAVGRGRSEIAVGPPVRSGYSDASETAMIEGSSAWTFDDVCIYSFAVLGLGVGLHQAYRYATAKKPVEFGSTYTTP